MNNSFLCYANLIKTVPNEIGSNNLCRVTKNNRIKRTIINKQIWQKNTF